MASADDQGVYSRWYNWFNSLYGQQTPSTGGLSPYVQAPYLGGQSPYTQSPYLGGQLPYGYGTAFYNPYFSQYRDNTEQTQPKTEPKKAEPVKSEEKKISNPGLVAAAVILGLIIVAGGITAAVILIPKTTTPTTTPTPAPSTETPVSLSVTLNDLVYSDALQNSASPEFQAAQKNVCDRLTAALAGNVAIAKCSVDTFLPGSVKASPILLSIVRNSSDDDVILTKIRDILTQKAKLDANFVYDKLLTKKNYCSKASQRTESTCTQVCETAIGAANRVCSCYEGYSLDTRDNRTCNDVNECTANSSVCGTGNMCINSPGAYRCQCGGNNVNEHTMLCRARKPCDSRPCEFFCNDTSGAAVCSCPPGYTVNGKVCADINECITANGGCSDTCRNTIGSFKCSCPAGSYLQDDMKNCTFGNITVATSPDRYNLTNGIQNPAKTITCTITLTGAAVNITNTNIKAKWIINGKETVSTVSGSGGTRTAQPYSISVGTVDAHGQYYCNVRAASMEKRAFTPAYYYGCEDGSFKCNTTNQCIPPEKVCDGKTDCDDKSDESAASCVCTSKYKCANYKCVTYAQVCDGKNDCGDWSDEGTTACATTSAAKGGVRTITACAGANKRVCPEKGDICFEDQQFCDQVSHCPLDKDEGDVCRLDYIVVCSNGTFKCDKKCVSNARRCDHIRHCIDGADEPNECASPSTGSNCFNCTSTQKCIPKTHACDGVVNCPDGSDEANQCIPTALISHFVPEDEEAYVKPVLSTCPEPYKAVTVGVTTQCLHPDLYCDGIKHTSDGKDEPTNCASACNTTTHFVCDGIRCLPNRKKCDGVKNCRDNADENGCSCTAENNKFPCQGTNVCLVIDRYCNGVIDCPQGDDEPDVCQIKCPSGFIRCEPNTKNYYIPIPPKCIPTSRVCDGKWDCPAGSDEYNCQCGLQRSGCSDLYGCVSNFALCDGRADCKDNSDETTKCAAAACPKGEFKCDGKCASESLYCDGAIDCKDKSDEPDDCLKSCGLSNVFCDGKCLASVARCDGRKDCSNGEDEINCFSPCPGFLCGDGICLPDKAKVCDFRADCTDNSDESGSTCKKATLASCPVSGMLYCDNQCYSPTLRCNGFKNCKDGSDEAKCSTNPGCGPPSKATALMKRQFYLLGKHKWQVRAGIFNTSCDDGMCIPFAQWCNGEVNCIDGSDEKPNCTIGCPLDTFKCLANQVCIPKEAKCDGIPDCDDMSDEKGCGGCAASITEQILVFGRTISFFTCTSGQCVSQTSVCDGVADCRDRSDEDLTLCCTGLDKFRCLDGRACVSMTSVCNGYSDCGDSSDESVCIVPVSKPACTSGQFTCKNGNCVDLDKRCNNINECVDGSDEDGCPCDTKNNWKCTVSNVCIREVLRCDGKPDCPPGDTSDETGCGICTANQFKCNNNRCVNNAVKCDGSNDCGDWSDELSSLCPCPVGSFTCTNPSICLPNAAYCNRKRDCPDGSDESTTCASSCKSTQLSCSGRCVDRSLQCDGTAHCPALEDEAEAICPNCPSGMFRCKDKSRCVPTASFCDGVYDCRDFSDEPADCRVCPRNEIPCGSACRPLSFICRFPDACPTVLADIKCSTKSLPFSASCGVPDIPPNVPGGAVPFIVNGREAVPCSLPWLVSLQYTDSSSHNYDFSHSCGGSIIGSSTILTAAHCFDDGQKPENFRIVAGAHDLTVNSDMTQIRQVTSIRIHPGYTTGTTQAVDLAILKVDPPFQYNKCIQPICVSNMPFPTGSKCIAAGFGDSFGTNVYGRNVLHDAATDIIPLAHCLRKAKYDENIICTSDTQSLLSNTCQGDSGGPLMCARDGKYHVAGVVAYTEVAGCLLAGEPDVWTEVSAYQTWITQNS